MKSVLAHVDAFGRVSGSAEAFTTTNGAGGRLRPVTKRRKRLFSSHVNSAKVAHSCRTLPDDSVSSSPYLPRSQRKIQPRLH